MKACTGSGKTLAFTVPLVQTLININESIKQGSRSSLDKSDVVSLILAPSRELAIQIYRVLEKFKSVIPEEMSMCYFIGGNKIEYDL